jgi:hypothetical protein
MLNKEDIERMLSEMGLQDEKQRVHFLEWAKSVTIKPEPKGQVFIRATTNTDSPKECEYGKLE